MPESEAKQRQALRAERIAAAASARLGKISASVGEGQYKREVPDSVLNPPNQASDSVKISAQSTDPSLLKLTQPNPSPANHAQASHSDPEEIDLAIAHPIPHVPVSAAPSPPQSNRLASYLRVTSVLLLIFYSVVYWEPAQHLSPSSWVMNWSGGLKPIPFVAAFVALQAIFFAIQFMFFPAEIQSGSKIASFAVYLPQPYNSYLLNLVRYWNAGLAAVSDACLVIVVLGLVSVYASWKANYHPDVPDIVFKSE